jgi:hypothetical protein
MLPVAALTEAFLQIGSFSILFSGASSGSFETFEKKWYLPETLNGSLVKRRTLEPLHLKRKSARWTKETTDLNTLFQPCDLICR